MYPSILVERSKKGNIVMKKLIVSADESAQNNHTSIEEYFSDFINRADHVGYELHVDDDVNLTMKANEDGDKMPKIEIATEKIADGSYIFSAVLTFPVLDSSALNFSDSLEYWTKKWNDVAEFITSILEFEFHLEYLTED